MTSTDANVASASIPIERARMRVRRLHGNRRNLSVRDLIVFATVLATVVSGVVVAAVVIGATVLGSRRRRCRRSAAPFRALAAATATARGCLRALRPLTLRPRLPGFGFRSGSQLDGLYRRCLALGLPLICDVATKHGERSEHEEDGDKTHSSKSSLAPEDDDEKRVRVFSSSSY
jgi:hypothetical protein